MKQILEYVQSFVTIGLLLAGIGGLAWHLFKEDGWLVKILGKIWDVQMANPLVAIPLTIAVLFVGKLWYDHNKSKGYATKLPDVLIYVVMAAGVYFIYEFVTHAV